MARRALQAEWAWDTVLWEDASDSQLALGLLDETPASVAQAAVSAPTYSVPKAFMDMARTVACHRSAHRWSLLYRVLWRITHGEHHLLKVAVDPDVHELHTMEKSVRRDVHKMRAFVRFREVVHEGRCCTLRGSNLNITSWSSMPPSSLTASPACSGPSSRRSAASTGMA